MAPQERLLDACATPARSQGSAQRCEPVDLATIAADGLRAHERLGGTRPLNAAQQALRTRGHRLG
jgi:hypothetical protein